MEQVIQADPNQTNRGKAYAITPTGDLVTLAPNTELRPGWRWATDGDVKLAQGVAKILKDEPDAPVDQVRDHVARSIEAAEVPVPAVEVQPSGASDQ